MSFVPRKFRKISAKFPQSFRVISLQFPFICVIICTTKNGSCDKREVQELNMRQEADLKKVGFFSFSKGENMLKYLLSEISDYRSFFSISDIISILNDRNMEFLCMNRKDGIELLVPYVGDQRAERLMGICYGNALVDLSDEEAAMDCYDFYDEFFQDECMEDYYL